MCGFCQSGNSLDQGLIAIHLKQTKLRKIFCFYLEKKPIFDTLFLYVINWDAGIGEQSFLLIQWQIFRISLFLYKLRWPIIDPS